MAEFPHQTYYPACKVRLIVRFDEFSDEPSAVPPKKPATMRKGQKDKGQVLDYIIDPDAPEGTKRYRLAGRGQTEAQEASKDNLTHVIEGIIPVSATLEKNTYKEADTLELSLSYLDLPFDPRTVRSCAVEFYLGTIDGDTWRESMRLQVIADLPDESEYGTNRQFKGWVDDWRVNWATRKRQRWSCRAATTLLCSLTRMLRLRSRWTPRWESTRRLQSICHASLSTKVSPLNTALSTRMRRPSKT